MFRGERGRRGAPHGFEDVTGAIAGRSARKAPTQAGRRRFYMPDRVFARSATISRSSFGFERSATYSVQKSAANVRSPPNADVSSGERQGSGSTEQFLLRRTIRVLRHERFD